MQQRLEEIIVQQEDAIEQAGALIASVLAREGLVHTFGTGHSHLLAEEMYSRAGGLLPVNVIQSAPLMLHEDAVASGQWERMSGVAEILLEQSGLDPARDVLIVISNSGCNAAPVEAAEWASAHHVPIIALTSLRHSQSQPSRAPSGKKLYEVADITLDNRGETGDAAIEIGPGLRIAPTSTIVGAFLIQAVVISTVEHYLRLHHHHQDVPIPIIRSANIEGADETNAQTVAAYPGRLPQAYERLRHRLVQQFPLGPA